MSHARSKTVADDDALGGANGAMHPVQRAWVTHNVPQCGYCQSGQIMSAVALAQVDAPTPEPPCRHRPRMGRQHLPMRDLPAHPRPRSTAAIVSVLMMIESLAHRRQFLTGCFDERVRRRVAPHAGGSVRAGRGAGRGRLQHQSRHGGGSIRSVYLGIEPDAPSSLSTHRSEMGRASAPRWPLGRGRRARRRLEPVRIEQGVGDTRYGDQNTDGSRSIRDFYDAFRAAGASARSMLVTAAATRFERAGRRADEGDHEVVHGRRKRSATARCRGGRESCRCRRKKR